MAMAQDLPCTNEGGRDLWFVYSGHHDEPNVNPKALSNNKIHNTIISIKTTVTIFSSNGIARITNFEKKNVLPNNVACPIASNAWLAKLKYLLYKSKSNEWVDDRVTG